MPTTIRIAPPDYPVDATGQTDSRPGFEQALDKLRGGGVLIVPPGTYVLSKAVQGAQNPSNPSYEPAHNYALRVQSSNLAIRSEGSGTVTFKPFQNQHDTTLLLFLGAQENISVTGITLEGLPTSADTFPAGGFTLGSLIVFYGTEQRRMRNLLLDRCVIKNAPRYGIYLAYLDNCRIAEVEVRYYDGITPPPREAIAESIGRVGIFSGTPEIRNVAVVGCTFDGRVGGQRTDDDGADGLLHFSKGGNFTISNNVIRNYKLEGIQCGSGPATVAGNSFYTEIGANSSVAFLAAPDGAGPPKVLAPLFTFSGNTVRGGAFGVLHKGVSCPSDVNGKPHYYRAVITGNSFELDDSLRDTAVIVAVAAEELAVVGNIAKGGSVFFSTGSTPLNQKYPRLNFLNRRILIDGNIHTGATNVGIFVQEPIDDKGSLIISNNTLSRGSYHVRLTSFSAGGATVLQPGCGHIEAGSEYCVRDLKQPFTDGGVVHDVGSWYDGQTFVGVSGVDDFTPNSEHVQVRRTGSYRVQMSGNLFLDPAGAPDSPEIAVCYFHHGRAPHADRGTKLVSDRSEIDGVLIERHFGRLSYSPDPPASPTHRFQSGDVIRNSRRSKGDVLFWEACEDNFFEPVFSAARGAVFHKTIEPAVAGNGIELCRGFTGHHLSVLNIEFLLQGRAVAWSGGAARFLRIRTTWPSRRVLAQVPLDRLRTKTLQQDIIYFSDNPNGATPTISAGTELPAGEGLEVVGVAQNGDDAKAGPGGSPVVVAVTILFSCAKSL